MRKIVLTLTALVAVTASAATTHYVNPDGSCGGNTPCLKSISEAVDAAYGGDTIEVAPGVYPELVFIKKQLVLRGAMAGVDARVCRTGESGDGESVLIGDAG